MKKINLKNIKENLSRAEMRSIMGGSGSGSCPSTTCSPGGWPNICANSGGNCGCRDLGGGYGFCTTHG